MLYGWVLAIVRAREMPEWMVKASFVIVTIGLIVFSIGVVLSILNYFRLSVDIVSVITGYFFVFVAIVVLVLAIFFVVIGFWLLRILNRTTMSPSKKMLMTKITRLMLVAGAYLFFNALFFLFCRSTSLIISTATSLICLMILQFLYLATYQTAQVSIATTYFEVSACLAMCFSIISALRLDVIDASTIQSSSHTASNNGNVGSGGGGSQNNSSTLKRFTVASSGFFFSFLVIHIHFVLVLLLEFNS